MTYLRSTSGMAGVALALGFGLPAAAQGTDMAALEAAAKAEGTLTTIALPHDWCDYGGVIDGFKAKYGIEVNGLNPDAGSADELEAIRPTRTTRARRRPT